MSVPQTLRAYAQLVRAPALFTAWSNIFAAHLLATGGEIRYPELLLLTGSSSALYSAGMVLNDCFDLDEDRRSRPGRPLPSGAVAVRPAWLTGWTLLVLGVLLAAALGPVQSGVATVLALCIILYDGLLKHSWTGGLVMASCRYLNWLLPLSVTGLSLANLLLPLPVFFYIAALTYLGSTETGAHSKTPLAVSAAFMLLAGVTVLLLNRTGILPHSWALPLFAVALLLVMQRLLTTARDFTPGTIQQTMKFLILGIIPLDSLLAFAGGPWWGGLIILVLLVPGRLLARIMYVT